MKRVAIPALFLLACGAGEPPPVVRVPPVASPSSTASTAPKRDAALAVAGAACVRNPKDSERCTDGSSALACQNGTWVALACRGARGCRVMGEADICDQSRAELESTCNLAGDFACARDGKAMLVCTNDRWTIAQACAGERACGVEGTKITCDNSTAKAEDACREDDDYACTPDGSTALVCRRGRFSLASFCRGPKACKVVGTKEVGFKVECDDSLAQLNDVCGKADHYACSQDGRAILRCIGATFAIEDRCKAKEKCAIRAGQVGCY